MLFVLQAKIVDQQIAAHKVRRGHPEQDCNDQGPDGGFGLGPGLPKLGRPKVENGDPRAVHSVVDYTEYQEDFPDDKGGAAVNVYGVFVKRGEKVNG